MALEHVPPFIKSRSWESQTTRSGSVYQAQSLAARPRPSWTRSKRNFKGLTKWKSPRPTCRESGRYFHVPDVHVHRRRVFKVKRLNVFRMRGWRIGVTCCGSLSGNANPGMEPLRFHTTNFEECITAGVRRILSGHRRDNEGLAPN